MAVSAADRAWIESHGGTVGVVSAQEAYMRGGGDIGVSRPEAIMPASEYYGTGLGAGAGIVGFPQPAPQPQIGPLAAVAALPAAAGALGLSMPAWLAAIIGVAGAGYAGFQALGGGEGGGLFGLNVLGGDDLTIGGLEFGGPGLPEPTAPYTEWHVGNKQFYYVKQYTPTGAFRNAKVAMYNRDTKRWKVWTLPKPYLAVIGKNMPRHQMITRLRKNLRRHTADAK
ncbi:unnamed protein product, partial [marine sediment metagenome]